MGEEYGESQSFLFTDFHGDLARAAREGRAKEFADHAGRMFRPECCETFQRSVNLTGSNSTVKRVKRGWRLPANYCFCASIIIVPLLSAARESSERYCKTAPGLIAASYVFRE